ILCVEQNAVGRRLYHREGVSARLWWLIVIIAITGKLRMSQRRNGGTKSKSYSKEPLEERARLNPTSARRCRRDRWSRPVKTLARTRPAGITDAGYNASRSSHHALTRLEVAT